MRRIMLIAIAALEIAGYIQRVADRAIEVRSPAHAAAEVPAARPRAPIHSGRTMTLDSGRGGHFETEARIAGRDVAFMVDTGASLVALRQSDAARIGIRPMRSDYTATVSTANGNIKAAPARLDRVEIGGITVYDVRAMVLPDEALGRNLLGMSFLSQLKRYEVADGRMVLEQ